MRSLLRKFVPLRDRFEAGSYTFWSAYVNRLTVAFSFRKSPNILGLQLSDDAFAERRFKSRSCDEYTQLRLPLFTHERNLPLDGKYRVYVKKLNPSANDPKTYLHGRYATLEEAIVASKKIVDDYLESINKVPKDVDYLLLSYRVSGPDPFILGAEGIPFKALIYAGKRCYELGNGCDGIGILAQNGPANEHDSRQDTFPKAEHDESGNGSNASLHGINITPDDPDAEEIEFPYSIFRALKDQIREDTLQAEKTVRHALDDLFHSSRQFRFAEEFLRLTEFVSKFRFYSPYNAMLIYMQRPGATYVATADRWRNEYGRTVKPGANPIVILRPRGPVMFVFDVSDTEPGKNAVDLPEAVTDPFAILSGNVGEQLELTIENAKRDGVGVYDKHFGAQQAGCLRVSESDSQLTVVKGHRERRQTATLPLRYEILVNKEFAREQKYVTLTHELGHLYCGHVGAWNTKYWPDRTSLDDRTSEFEAESVSYIVCERLGVKNSFQKYLAKFFKDNNEIPDVSPEVVLKAAGLIEEMGKGHLPLRKDK